MELLAPAGNLDMLRVAVDNGADSIYVGPRGWSRRRDSFELSDEEIRRAVGIAHDGGAKLRIAVNTNMQSRELPALLEKMATYVSWGIDGAIMTDVGAIARVHERFRALPIHASIGANILNNEDVRFYRSIGVTQVVADTKLTLSELASRQTEIDVGIEVLIHSNKCYTYLGKCWMSPYHRLERTVDPFGKDLFKGSPNRGGLDHRVCLESWELYRGPELLEPRVALKNDAFFLVDDIPKLIDLGVHCLKIQGREYSVALAGEIVRFYRDLIDVYRAHPKGAPFDLAPWHARLASIQTRRDEERTQSTAALLAEARLPVVARSPG